MTLTHDDIQSIKELLESFKNDIKNDISGEIERKIATAMTNLERTQKVQRGIETGRLEYQFRREIQTTENNLKILFVEVSRNINEVKEQVQNMSREIVDDLLPIIVTQDQIEGIKKKITILENRNHN